MTKKYLNLIFFVQSIFGLYVNDSCILDHDGSPGICKIDTQCSIAEDLLKCKKIRPTLCGFEKELQSVICCPINQENLDDCGDQARKIERISVQKCEEYKTCLLEENLIKLDIDEYAIVGGTEVAPGQYPHMALIGWVKLDGSGYGWNCGGSLISEFWVITAAHCTYSYNIIYQTHEPSVIRLGEHNIKLKNETEIQDFKIDKIICNPKYEPPYKYHDIALLRFSTEAKFNKYVRPICIWQTESIEGLKPIATGLGNIGYIEKSSEFLQSVEIDLINTTYCNTFYNKGKRALPNGIIAEQLCAGDLSGGKDTCQGDSGGPLQIPDSKTYCDYHLIGITSFGVGCGGVDSPAVYTRVSSYVDWIELIVWPESDTLSQI